MATMLDFTAPAELPAGTGSGLFDRAVLLSVEFRSWGRSRKLAASQYQVDVRSEDDKRRRTTGAKKLLEDAAEIKTIAALYSQTRQWLAARALPSAMRSGVYLWPVTMVPEAMAYLEAARGSLGPLVDDLARSWDGYVAADMQALAGVASAQDYPAAEALPSSYSIAWLVFEAAAPGALARVDTAAYEAARASAAAVWDDALAQGLRALSSELDGLLGHLAERLAPGADGRQRTFHASTVTALDEWAELYRGRSQVIQSPDLDAVVERVRSMMLGVDADALRGSESLRERIAERATEIRQAIADAAVSVAPARKLTIMEDDL